MIRRTLSTINLNKCTHAHTHTCIHTYYIYTHVYLLWTSNLLDADVMFSWVLLSPSQCVASIFEGSLGADGVRYQSCPGPSLMEFCLSKQVHSSHGHGMPWLPFMAGAAGQAEVTWHRSLGNSAELAKIWEIYIYIYCNIPGQFLLPTCNYLCMELLRMVRMKVELAMPWAQ